VTTPINRSMQTLAQKLLGQFYSDIGRKGGVSGRGADKRRGDPAHYAELGRKSGEARRERAACILNAGRA
jgi:general stress protein YciG